MLYAICYMLYQKMGQNGRPPQTQNDSDRFQSFQRCCCQWRFVRVRKRLVAARRRSFDGAILRRRWRLVNRRRRRRRGRDGGRFPEELPGEEQGVDDEDGHRRQVDEGRGHLGGGGVGVDGDLVARDGVGNLIPRSAVGGQGGERAAVGGFERRGRGVLRQCVVEQQRHRVVSAQPPDVRRSGLLEGRIRRREHRHPFRHGRLVTPQHPRLPEKRGEVLATALLEGGGEVHLRRDGGKARREYRGADLENGDVVGDELDGPHEGGVRRRRRRRCGGGEARKPAAADRDVDETLEAVGEPRGLVEGGRRHGAVGEVSELGGIEVVEEDEEGDGGLEVGGWTSGEGGGGGVGEGEDGDGLVAVDVVGDLGVGEEGVEAGVLGSGGEDVSDVVSCGAGEKDGEGEGGEGEAGRRRHGGRQRRSWTVGGGGVKDLIFEGNTRGECRGRFGNFGWIGGCLSGSVFKNGAKKQPIREDVGLPQKVFALYVMCLYFFLVITFSSQAIWQLFWVQSQISKNH